jgi:hypothetical protein
MSVAFRCEISPPRPGNVTIEVYFCLINPIAQLSQSDIDPEMHLSARYHQFHMSGETGIRRRPSQMPLNKSSYKLVERLKLLNFVAHSTHRWKIRYRQLRRPEVIDVHHVAKFDCQFCINSTKNLMSVNFRTQS